MLLGGGATVTLYMYIFIYIFLLYFTVFGMLLGDTLILDNIDSLS